MALLLTTFFPTHRPILLYRHLGSSVRHANVFGYRLSHSTPPVHFSDLWPLGARPLAPAATTQQTTTMWLAARLLRHSARGPPMLAPCAPTPGHRLRGQHNNTHTHQWLAARRLRPWPAAHAVPSLGPRLARSFSPCLPSPLRSSLPSHAAHDTATTVCGGTWYSSSPLAMGGSRAGGGSRLSAATADPLPRGNQRFSRLGGFGPGPRLAHTLRTP